MGGIKEKDKGGGGGVLGSISVVTEYFKIS